MNDSLSEGTIYAIFPVGVAPFWNSTRGGPQHNKATSRAVKNKGRKWNERPTETIGFWENGIISKWLLQRCSTEPFSCYGFIDEANEVVGEWVTRANPMEKLIWTGTVRRIIDEQMEEIHTPIDRTVCKYAFNICNETRGDLLISGCPSVVFFNSHVFS